MSTDQNAVARPVSVGDVATRDLHVTQATIDAFADATGDRNPVHVDPAFAATTQFGRPIAHGLIAVSVLTALMGTELPGSGSVHLGQELRFRAPVFPGDTVTARVEVTALDAERGRVTLATTCTNQHGTVVVDGTASVLNQAAVAA